MQTPSPTFRKGNPNQQGQKRDFKKDGKYCNHVFKQLSKAAMELHNYSLWVQEECNREKVISKKKEEGRSK